MKERIIVALGAKMLLCLAVLLLHVASADAQEYRAPNNFHEYKITGYTSVMKGAVPGFAKKPKYFDAKKAEEQLRYLYNEKRVRVVISLDHCKDIGGVITKINKKYSGVGLVHICRKIRRGKSDSQYEKNITLFEEISHYIGNVPFYIHCRYGAHRAVTALSGAWVSYGNLSFDEAFKRTGGKKRAFRSKGQKKLLNHAKRYSKDLME